MAMAPILGPILGGWLTSAFGWRANFALLPLFGVVTFLGVLLVLPETNRRPDPGATRPSTLLTNYSSLLTDRLYLGRVAITAFTYSGIFTFISGSAYVLIEVVGLTPDRYGLCFAGGVLGWVLGTMIAGRFGKTRITVPEGTSFWRPTEPEAGGYPGAFPVVPWGVVIPATINLHFLYVELDWQPWVEHPPPKARAAPA